MTVPGATSRVPRRLALDSVFPHNSFELPRRTGERFSTPGLVDVPAAAAAVAMGKKMIKGKYFSKMGGRHTRTLYSTVVSRAAAAEGGTPGDGGVSKSTDFSPMYVLRTVAAA